ncbi:prolipoprotein diacylglyceryl transferase, partial [Mycolicibacterium sp.]
MTTTVLAYLPSPSQGVWHLGPVPIRAYALCIILGIVAALIIGDRRWEARGGERGVIYDIALWAVPFGLIGGRLYHVMTDWRTYFGPEGKGLGAAFQVWEGGLGIWGAVALGGVGAWIGCRRHGIPLPAFGDAIAPGIILAQAIGRIGNYFNQELYGRETTLPWGLEIYQRLNVNGVRDDLNGVSTGEVLWVVHPTFLYELLWNLLVFALLLWADRRFKLGHGRLFALYVAGYCLGRFWIELMRSDLATHVAGIRINTFTSAFVLIGAVVYMMLAPKGREAPASLAGNHADDDSGESAVDELGKELVTAAAGTGVVAAATVAGQDDIDDADHMHPDEVSADEGAEAAAAVEMKAIVGEPEEAVADEEAAEAEPSEEAEGDEASTDAAEAEAEADVESADDEDEAVVEAVAESESEDGDAAAEAAAESEPAGAEAEAEVTDEAEPEAEEPEVEAAEQAVAEAADHEAA